MNKRRILFLSVLSIFVCLNLSAQNVVPSDSEVLKAFAKVQSISDAQNDRFLDYYEITIENTSEVTQVFTVQLEYIEDGEKRLTDNTVQIKLLPGELIIGHRSTMRELTLFKSFNVGNSGKKVSDKEVELLSLKFNMK